MLYGKDPGDLVGTASAPPATPPPVATPKVDVGGYTPDYGSLITHDPSYISAKNAADAASGAATAARQERLRQAYIRYGGNLPTGFSDQFGDIDQATKDAASQNQNSTIARLAQNYQQSTEQFKRQLASRHMLQSGDLNYGQDQLDRGYGQQQYDAANSFLDQAGGVYGDYLGAVSTNASNMANAIGTAEQSVYSNPAYRPVEPVTATYDPSSSAQFGAPIYGDGSGNYYDVNGSPFDPVQAAADAVRNINVGYAG